MAELLYRLGRFAARRHWTVIGAWLAVLALSAVTYVSFAGALSTNITLPDTPTTRVSQQLERDFEGAGGGAGAIVAETSDGSAFTAAQEDELVALFDRVAEVESVADVADPFATQEQLDSSAQRVADGKAQLTDGQAQLTAGQAQIDGGREALAAQRTQAREDGTLASIRGQLDAAEQQLDDGQAELDRQQARIDEQAPQLEQGATVSDLSSGFRTVSEDGSAAVANVTFDVSTNEVTAEVKTEIEDLVAEAGIDGVDVHPSQDIAQTVPSILGPGEIAGVVVAAVVLFVMLGTVLGAALPLLTALLGVGVASLASLSFSGLVEFVSVTPVLGVMLGLAVGIDYSLFIINRHRRQLKQGADLHESIGLANGTSGNAVVFAGVTVIVALLALNVTGVGFLGLMGTVGAVAVLVAILMAITLTPAVLALVGPRILRRRERARLATGEAYEDDAKITDRDKPMSTTRAWTVLGLGVAALLVIAAPATQMRLGLPDGSTQPPDSAGFKAYDIQAQKFGDGSNGPLLVVADLPAPVGEDDVLAEQAAIGEALGQTWNVEAVVPIGASQDRSALAFQVIPAGSPSSESTAELVQNLRNLTPETAAGGEATLGVAGNASAGIDISDKLSEVLPLYLVLVVGLSLLILILVFRSILVPLTATLGFVLSLLAAFGGITAIFQIGFLSDLFGVHAPGPVLSFLPIIATGILFGLAMDYQLFLVSGMREAYAHGAPARVAVQHGLRAGRAVVTAAAIIMISVFAGFIFSHDATIKPIGFGLAFGVLLDAFVVRMLLIPAAMHLLGESAWWLPKWLDRILPDVDVEGARLERSHPVHQTADEVATAT
ncbi:putative drug exporter of the RND superfamily [Nocardioides alpinus]|uniref:MMPL family transporter n=1 Tax=Nocardioides alpinus TaxID=748909 RepID=A0A1I0Z8A6_9ACTN|nr:MMPL family transporter [Nocardioides alpinus]PKH38333.1 MMPL family transporter [Nocardioides alpinus]SFB21761.1 putative drug exporter of the RND superfamily [Nocardioides alpinus]